MLISIKINNFRSYYGQNEINFTATSEQRWKESLIIPNKSLYNKAIVPSLMIMGMNGAGKSNALKALNYANYLIDRSAQATADNKNIFIEANQNYAFIKEYEKKPYEFEVEFIYKEFYFNYGFCITDGKVSREFLYSREESNKDRLSKLKVHYIRNYQKYEKIDNEFQKIEDIAEVSPTTLFLSVCNGNIKKEMCTTALKVIDWFDSIMYFTNSDLAMMLYDNNQSYLEKATKFIQLYDKSIRKIEIQKKKIDISNEKLDDYSAVIQELEDKNIDIQDSALVREEDGLYAINIYTYYNVYDTDGSLVEECGRKFNVTSNDSRISLGQNKLIRLLANMFSALEDGNLFVCDELDARLHHQFPQIIIDLFNDSTINKNNAQLLFTTHAYSLMDLQIRNDQIRIVSKDERGVSKIEKLSRNDENRIKKTNLRSKLWEENQYNGSANVSMDEIKKIILE